MRYLGMWLAISIMAAAVSADARGKEGRKMADMNLSSPAFAGNGAIPALYTCDGRDVNPPLRIENVPDGARSLALIVDDPDAPAGMWVHWVVWNIDPTIRDIGENSVPTGAVQGKNDWRRNSYGGPCPPSGAHRYFFKLYALDTTFSLGTGTTKTDLEKTMAGHVLAHAQLIGIYQRR